MKNGQKADESLGTSHTTTLTELTEVEFTYVQEVMQLLLALFTKLEH